MSDDPCATAAFGSCSECGHTFARCTPRFCPACGHAVMTQAEYDEQERVPLPTATAATDGHQHECQPNGTVEIDREQCSPCSRMDDALWTDVISVAICRCGKIKRTRVGTKNERRRGDDIRRARARRGR